MLCEDWAKQLGTFAGVEGRKDLVQALCTLAVEMLHDTCCCDSSEEPANSQALVWENSKAVLSSVCSRASQFAPSRSLEAQARAS